MEHNGFCPNCGTPVRVEEFPGNVVFLVDNQAVRECPKCETVLIYAEVMGITPDVEPAQ